MVCVGFLSESLEIRKDRQFTYNVRLRCVRVTTITAEKVISITYFECVFVALVIQHVNRVRRIILSSVSSLALPCVFTLFYKRHEFCKKLLRIKCVLGCFL